MKMNKETTLTNYNDAVDGVDDATTDLLNARNLLSAQYDELADINDVSTDSTLNSPVGCEFKHYADELIALNAVTDGLIRNATKLLSKKIKSSRESLSKMLKDKQKAGDRQ